MLKERLVSHLKEIVRDRDPYFASQGHFYVREYIYQEFQQYGNVDRHCFTHQGQDHQNIILSLSPDGDTMDLAPVIVGAHYDAVPGCPGADDNATGVAVLLEIARCLSDEHPSYPLQLIAFDLEEFGYVGSDRYVSQCRQQKQPIRLAISLEMLGYFNDSPRSQRYPPGLEYFYPDRGNFIALVGNLTAIRAMRKLHRHFQKNGMPCQWLPVPFQGKIVPETRRSDHAPFWDNGYDAIMVTDTAHLRNPHYHQTSDRLETLDLDRLVAVCQGLTSYLKSG